MQTDIPRRRPPSALTLALLLAALPLRGADGADSVTEAIVDLRASLQTVTPEHCQLRLELVDLLPKAKDAKKPDEITRHALSADLVRIDATWRPASASTSTEYGWAKHPLDASGLRLDRERLAGTLVVQVTPDKPKRGEPERAVETVTVAIDAIVKDGGRPAAGEDLAVARFWTITPQAQAELLAVDGTWTARIAGADVSGKVDGLISRTLRPGFWNMGDWDDGLRLSFDLGTTRQNWNFARVAVLELPAPKDLRAHRGIRIAARSPKPRVDVSASVFVREQDGSWYYLKSGLPLCDSENRADLLFADFSEAEWVAPEGSHMDEDYVLDLAAISHVAVGIVDPLGPGRVDLVVTELAWLVGAPPTPPAVQVAVSGRTLAMNGAELVPAGVFGGYAPDLPASLRPGCQRQLGGPVSIRAPQKGESFNIDCWFDRYAGANLLGDPNWQEKFATWGREYGARARALQERDPGLRCHLEFWNEPYLNWATRPGKNYKPDCFDRSEAREGGPVTVLYRNKDGTTTRGPTIPFFAWTRKPSVFGGDWSVIDTTQFTYWSGRGNQWIYDQMLMALAPALKAENPEAKLIPGWGFRWNEDRWAAWEMLYKPTIDNSIAWIDGVNEHHYQGDPTAIGGAYEVLAAYGMTRYGKWLPGYNTETNDLIDAPARGVVDTPEKAQAATDYRKMTYNLRDCIHCVAQLPDKALGRTVIHAAGWNHHPETESAACVHCQRLAAGTADRGIAMSPLDTVVVDDQKQGKRMVKHALPHRWASIAYGLMSDLRGRLVETTSSDPLVLVAASIDGTDPRAMPPPVDGEPAGRSLVVVVFNDDRRPRTITVALTAPTGTTFSPGRTARAVVDDATYAIDLIHEPAPADGKTAAFPVTLPGRSAWKVALPLDGEPPAAAQVRRRQCFAPEILATVLRDQPLRATVAIDPAALGQARRAWLRLVLEDVAPGEGQVAMGGTALPLPAAWTADNNNLIAEIPLDRALLAEQVELTFTVQPGNHAGYRVDMASVVLEERD